jgi:hypothetical protein
VSKKKKKKKKKKKEKKKMELRAMRFPPFFRFEG